ncbi:MAG: N-acetyl-gamma-glutamyl-phosphate reductase [Candidatus Firestonebacteria bacterium]
MSNKLKVGIVGATGYSGIELIRILLKHPYVELSMLTSESYSGLKVKKALPFFDLENELVSFNAKKTAENSDVVFLCLPHTKSMEAAAAILKAGKKLVDLSADFRLKDKKMYEKWYGAKHTKSELLKESVYGMPEINREAVKGSYFVANPGCYPTSIILGAFPAVKAKLVDASVVIVNSISGASGAGRKAKAELMFSETGESLKAYKVGVHQHTPEIEMGIAMGSGNSKVRVSFTPHLAPVNRGILTTISFSLKKKISTAAALEIYKEIYCGEEFVHVLSEGQLPETKYVAGSNYCDIGIKVDSRTNRLVVISAIDNLVKGASGQAVQNMNLMCGFKENTALQNIGMMV